MPGFNLLVFENKFGVGVVGGAKELLFYFLHNNFILLCSKNSHNPNSNVERLQVPIKAEAKVELLG